MGNLAMSGVPPAAKESMGMDYSNFPPWIALWIPLYMDILCGPLQCRHSWRSYLPDSLGGPGGWFSEEFEIAGVTSILPAVLSFEEFQTQQGFTVANGSGVFAGLRGWINVNDWLESLFKYMFETSSTALSDLMTPTGFGTVVVLVLLIKLIKAILVPLFETLGRNLAREAHGDAWLEENGERITKFGEYIYRLCYHSFISALGFYFFWNAPWWNKDQGGTVNLFNLYPHDPVKPSMAWYYLFQAAYNVDAMVSLLQISLHVRVFPKDSALPLTIGWADTVRGDFNEMLAHHIVTNTLIFLSSKFQCTRIGSMVFFMHDLSDVPVDLAKLANFVKWRNATVGSFFLMMFMWFVTRIYVLPFTIWAAIYYEGQLALIGNPESFKLFYYAYQPLFLVLLAILIALHLVWFSMFVNMGMLLISKGETHDLTEHKRGEESEASPGVSRKSVTANGGTKKKIT